MFETLADQLSPGLAVRWAWVDVEDEAQTLGDFEPANFPMLAVQRNRALLYCAALPQKPEIWLRLITELAQRDSAETQDVPQVSVTDMPDLRSLFGGAA